MVDGEMLNQSRHQLKILIGLLTGHCHFKGHLFKLRLVNSHKCDTCKHASETASHILCDCKALATLRYRHCGHHLMKSADYENISISKIVHFVQGAGMLNERAEELHKTSITVNWWPPTCILFYSILDVKEHPVNVLSVGTLQYVNHNAVILPLNWKSITKFFAECFTFKKLRD